MVETGLGEKGLVVSFVLLRYSCPILVGLECVMAVSCVRVSCM
jgi:hypothetical protein